MQNLGGRTRIAIVTSLLCTWAFLAYACAPDDENPATTRTLVDSGSGDGMVDPQGMGDADLGKPICGNHGGYANVKTIAAAVIAQVKTDCRISSPIASLDGNGAAHLEECFEILMGGAFQCDGVAYVAGTSTDSKGQKCRDMTSAHKQLGLRAADFNAFVEDIATVLKAKGLTQDEIRAIAPAFEGTRTGVVQNNTQPDKDTYCTCPNSEYMGKSCVPEGGIDGGYDADTGTTDSGDAGDSG